MGKAIEQVAINRGHLSVLQINTGNRHKLTTENLNQCDVAIEFTSPGTAYENILKCFNAGIPVVCGTTGWYDKLPAVKEICELKNLAFIYAPNFSIGVNIFFELNNLLAGLMNSASQYDVLIEETHHQQKLDKPSGTAITLANEILRRSGRKKTWTLKDDDKDDALHITCRREKDAIGTHIVKYVSEADEISIQHAAFSRSGFAHGAMLAAEWIISRKGFYHVSDMLK